MTTETASRFPNISKRTESNRLGDFVITQTSTVTELTGEYSDTSITDILKSKTQSFNTNMTLVSTTLEHTSSGSLTIDTSSAPIIGNHATPFTPFTPPVLPESPTSFLLPSTTSTRSPSTTPSSTNSSTIKSSTTAAPQRTSASSALGVSKPSSVITGAIVGGTVGGVALLIGVILFVRLRRKRRPTRIKTTDIQLMSSLHDPEVQNSAREMFRTTPQYLNLPTPPQPPTAATSFSQQSKVLELGITTPQKTSTPKRPMNRPDTISEDVLEAMRASLVPPMEFMRDSSDPVDPNGPLPVSYLGRSELGSPADFRDDRRDTGESYGLPVYRQQSFNRTVAEEHPELYSPVLDGTRNLFLKTAIERNLPLDKLARESLRDPQSQSSYPNIPLHYSKGESQLFPPPLRIDKDGDSVIEGISQDQSYNTHASDPGSGTTYVDTLTSQKSSPSMATDDTLRVSQMPLSKEALELDRINTQRCLGGLQPLPPGTPISKWRTSEAPTPPREVPRYSTASSVYPESDVPMPPDHRRYPGDQVDRSRLDEKFMEDGEF